MSFDLNLIAGIIGGGAAVFGVSAWRSFLKKRRLIRKGKRAEKSVAKELKRLRKRDNIVLNDLLIPSATGRSSQIDHVVVSRRGIFVIETKSHAGRITGSEHSQYWQQHLSDRSKTLYNPLLQNRAHIRTLRRLIPETDEDRFVSVVLFTDAWRLEIKADDIVVSRRFLPDRHIQRTFIPTERVAPKWWRPNREVRLDEKNIVLLFDDLLGELSRRKKILSRSEIRKIADMIRDVDSRTKASVRQHTEYARDVSRRVSEEIKRGVCPRCGGRLVVKKGEKGEFVGCENYPDCRFICSIDRFH